MITPKEKAEELVNKYTTVLSLPLSKEFALIAVDEIIKYCCGDDVLFLHKVKQEIEKL